MKILLIKPKWYLENAPYKYNEVIRFPPVNLGIIAALSEGHDVEIVDEDEEEIPFHKTYDVVGITVVAFTANRAFEISERFRDSKTKTILGGIHPSLVPNECIKHADSVVIGEVEYQWKRILKDIKENELKRFYDCSKDMVKMDNIPIPRRDLYKKRYIFEAIQTTRGCTNKCKFCYLNDVPWSKFRKRNIQEVIDEIKSIKTKNIIFLDDNLFLDKEYAKKLFYAMIPLKKMWWAQAPTNISDDPELIRLMKKSGCYAVAVGFQSINQDSLNSLNVLNNNVNNYKKLIDLLHKNNIMVQSFFMFGFDNDTKEIFKNTVNIIKKLDIDDAYLYILTPYPGTKIYKELDKQGKIIDKDYSRYNWYNCIFQPKNMTPDEIHKGIRWSYKELQNHFKKVLPRKIIKYFYVAIKNPKLARVILQGQLNKIDLNKLT